jgi:sugar phosphate isomerase/epimerase
MHILNTQFEPQLFNQNPRTRDDAFLWLRKALSAGRAMGATHYTFHGISRVKRESRSGKYDPKAVWGRALEEVRSTCAEYGITLCLETVEWASYNHPGVFRDMREYCPDLHGVLDVKQARISGYPYGMYIKEMAGALAHVHVSDVDDKGKICLPGKGIFNFPELLKRLNDAGFDGPLLIEVYKNDYADPKELKTSCDYLDELIYKYGF